MIMEIKELTFWTTIVVPCGHCGFAYKICP
jgi:hypothetical protein